MKYRYIGKEKYWDEKLNKQVLVGEIVDEKLLKDSYYEEIESEVVEMKKGKSKNIKEVKE